MNEREKMLLSWSSGKDSAWALHVLKQRENVEVAGLLTTLNQKYERVAMHAVREQLLEKQASAAGLPLWKVPLPDPCSNEAYEAAMAEAMARAKEEGIYTIAFGDLFLEDIRTYREEKLAKAGMNALFPLWGSDTKKLSRDMISSGLRTQVTCVDPGKLPASFAGRVYDSEFLAELPKNVDPCGEHGEFHTFCWDGPMFDKPVAIKSGEIVERGGFVFADVLPAGDDA